MADSNLGFGNPFFEQQAQDSLGDMTRAFNLSVTPSIRSAMARSGSFGNSGLEQMAGEAERTLQASLGRQANDMRAGNYWTGQQFGRQLFQDAQANNLNNATFGLGLLGTLNGFNQQDLSNATAVQNTPMQYWNSFMNSANAVGQGFGTSTGSYSMPGSPMMGALGGWQLGSSFGKSLGADRGVSPGQVAQGGWGTGNSWGNQDYGQFF